MKLLRTVQKQLKRRRQSARRCTERKWKESSSKIAWEPMSWSCISIGLAQINTQACASPAYSKTELTAYLYPHPPCPTTIMSPSTSVIALNTASPTSPPTSGLTETSSTSTSPSSLFVSSCQVKKHLERLNQNKAAGPDGVSPRLLKTCAQQLCGILQHLQP